MSQNQVRDHDKFMLRLPDGVREMLKLQAEHNKRSMNAEIVARLLESLEPWKPGDDPHRQAVTKHVFEPTSLDIKDINLGEAVARLEEVTKNLRLKMPET